ncbi:proton-coupled zinc antiporter SLC30A9, mitochondrial [Hemibagrus wyckioides]|uniref:proton-coupled zinc antiporter SLC30A9, mitochondrial n=1 Tax=Hemibagrus wyckioides TaxID=337641 RepID=UPI00266C9CC9|nr:proton-coupled zinc antiporter SLC30A9, mitochondrial [Hemibagrus wyckioides]
MTPKLQQVIRLLMVLIRSNRGKSRAVVKGGLLVLVSTPPTYTVAAAGPWCSKVAKKHIKKEATDRLSSIVSLCHCPYPEELCKFSDNFGPLRFSHSFQVNQDCEELEIARFLHRFSLVHAQITVIFKVMNKQQIHQQVFSVKSTYSMLGHAIAMDSAAFGQTPFSVKSLPSCNQMHPVLGETLSLLLSPEAVEAGLCGEVSISTMAVLGPCMKQYPNWPTRISRICFLVYSPSGVPLMRGESEMQLSFLQSLADSLPRGELGLPQVRSTQTHPAHDCVCSEVDFSIDNDHSEEPMPKYSRAVSQDVKLEQSRPVEQTLIVFIFLQHNDPFNSQLSDLITNEETLETHLDKVLWCNGEKVKSALQSLLENTLKEFLKRKKAGESFQTAMSVILSSVNSIVRSSSSVKFRSACLNSMKVQNTHDLSISMHQTLQRVIHGRFTSRPKCTTDKAEEEAVSEQNSTETCEEGELHCPSLIQSHIPGLTAKRAHEATEMSLLTSKRQCPETTARDSETSTSSVWESPVASLFCAPLSEELGEEMCLAGTSSGPLYDTEIKNQEVKSNRFQWCFSRLASARMFPCLAHRPWQKLCRVYLHQRAHLSQLPPRVSRPCYGWQNRCKGHSLWFSFPDPRGASVAWAQVQYFSTTSSSKDGPPPESGQSGTKPTDEVLTAKPSKEAAGFKPLSLSKAESIQVKVRAVLKKREYGTKYTQNNFITAVRAMNEFCLRPSDLEQLRKIRRRSPHDDTEAFTVFLRSDVEAKALEVWGSMEALARERNLRKEVEQQYQENIFRNQQLIKEYKDFWGNTKPRSGKRATFLQGPGKVVMVAICINGLNFFFKLLAWVYTGSASMFSEAIHSLADTCNQALLALGISQSVRNPDPGHPYGFSNMRYIASLISGVGIFMMGAGLSWYHGIIGLMHPHPIESLLWAYCILAGSLVSEGATLLVAINEIKKSAHKQGLSFYEYVMQSRDPSTNVVLLEDAAAVLGVVMAAGCMGLTSLTGNPYYDSLGSLGVGTLLGTVSAFLIYTNTEALLGRSIQAEHVQKLTEFLENDPAVRAIHDVKATDMGLSKVRFKAEVDFDGRVVTRSYLEKQDIEQILNDIQQVKTPEELEAFMLKHGENIIDTLGAEVDRLEKELKQRNPEVRHVDLEIL